MFRLGDFYELFYEDAVTAARELEITLTARNKEKGQPIPMCGVPYHAAENYIARLIQKGYRVAICDQMEEPPAATKLVRREVTRIVTPGTAMNASVLRSHENNYLAAVMPDSGDARRGCVTSMSPPASFARPRSILPMSRPALETLNAREVLAARRLAAEIAVPEDRCRAVGLRRGLRRAQSVRSFPSAVARRLRAGGPPAGDRRGGRDPALSARDAAQRARSSGTPRRSTIAPMRWCWMRPRFAIWNWSSRCSRANRRNRRCSHVLDRTRTGMGGRLLRRRLLAPSIDIAEIEARLDAVAELHAATILRANSARIWRRFSIWSGCSRRSALATAGPRDLRALARSLAVVPVAEAAPVRTRSPRACEISATPRRNRRSSRSAFWPRSPMSRR